MNRTLAAAATLLALLATLTGPTNPANAQDVITTCRTADTTTDQLIATGDYPAMTTVWLLAGQEVTLTETTPAGIRDYVVARATLDKVCTALPVPPRTRQR